MSLTSFHLEPLHPAPFIFHDTEFLEETRVLLLDVVPYLSHCFLGVLFSWSLIPCISSKLERGFKPGPEIQANRFGSSGASGGQKGPCPTVSDLASCVLVKVVTPHFSVEQKIKLSISLRK